VISINPTGSGSYNSAVYSPNMTLVDSTVGSYGGTIGGTHSYRLIADAAGNYLLKIWTTESTFNYTVKSSHELLGGSTAPIPSPPSSIQPTASPTPPLILFPTPPPTPSATPSATPSITGMVSFWKCEEGIGTILADSVGQNDGLITGAVYVSSLDPRLGKALQFDGNAFVTVADSPTLNPSVITVEAWIYMDQLPPDLGYPSPAEAVYDIVSKFECNPDLGFELHVSQGHLKFTVGNGDYSGGNFGGWLWAEGATNLTAGQWYHVAGTYDGNNIIVYLNGVQDGLTTKPTGYTYANSAAPFEIGGHHESGGSLERSFKGKIDEIALYNEALSADEIASHHENGLQGTDYIGGATPTLFPWLSPSSTDSSSPTSTDGTSASPPANTTLSADNFPLLAGIIAGIAVPLSAVAVVVQRKRRNKPKAMAEPTVVPPPPPPPAPFAKSANHVFISHVEEDANIALEIAQGLEEAGYKAWFYERDSIPGASYILKTSQAIEQSQAVVLIISPHSLGSHQVHTEVITTHEAGKPIIPILHGIAHVEFQQRQPEWRRIMGSATSIALPKQGTSAILPRIIAGLADLGIQKGSETGKT